MDNMRSLVDRPDSTGVGCVSQDVRALQLVLHKRLDEQDVTQFRTGVCSIRTDGLLELRFVGEGASADKGRRTTRGRAMQLRRLQDDPHIRRWSLGSFAHERQQMREEQLVRPAIDRRMLIISVRCERKFVHTNSSIADKLKIFS